MIRVCLLASFIVAGVLGASGISEMYSKFETDLPKEVAPFTLPLKNSVGDKYCSSVAISYKGKDMTLTNNHCCDYGKDLFGGKAVRVGNHIEDILFQSPIADVCVLTSNIKNSPIKLATKEFDLFDKMLIMGYPRGDFLVPRYGRVILKGEEVCIAYADDTEKCVDSNFTSAISYGGNSGSPVFNEKGELVNLLYAGPSRLHTYSITVPLVFVQAAVMEGYIRLND